MFYVKSKKQKWFAEVVQEITTLNSSNKEKNCLGKLLRNKFKVLKQIHFKYFRIILQS